jgi:hypothetical protein
MYKLYVVLIWFIFLFPHLHYNLPCWFFPAWLPFPLFPQSVAEVYLRVLAEAEISSNMTYKHDYSFTGNELHLHYKEQPVQVV